MYLKKGKLRTPIFLSRKLTGGAKCTRCSKKKKSRFSKSCPGMFWRRRSCSLWKRPDVRLLQRHISGICSWLIMIQRKQICMMCFIHWNGCVLWRRLRRKPWSIRCWTGNRRIFSCWYSLLCKENTVMCSGRRN